ncbi:MAG: hypothetical protein JXA94_02660, partial [Parachlamydiales bacterium]|nr:hypothetical protein [Parachlamydiales bacterium]
FSFFVFTLARPVQFESEMQEIKESKSRVDNEIKIADEALFLKPQKLEFFDFLFLKDEIDVCLNDPRPDQIDKKNIFEIKIKSSNEECKIFENEKLYLDILDENRVKFSKKDKKAFCSLYLNFIDSNKVKINIEADLSQFGIDEIIKNSFTKDLSDNFYNKDLLEFAIGSEFKIFSLAKLYTEDKLLSIYFKNNENKNQKRLEIDSCIHYIDDKDILIFQDGKWEKPKDGIDTKKYSIARVKSIDSKLAQIEAWNVEGDKKYLFTFSYEPSKPMVSKADFITSARKRTNTYISILVNKQRLIVKENDLIIKKDLRYRLLKKDLDFSKIQKEEIFYFEKIEKRNKEMYLIGYLFNPMHTTIQKIEIPMTSNISQSRNKRGII